jgi:hypothetical protein
VDTYSDRNAEKAAALGACPALALHHRAGARAEVLDAAVEEVGGLHRGGVGAGRLHPDGDAADEVLDEQEDA